ncbi:unnamed protein product [Prorocentrum cordatum]|uniref:Protein xylosyltransferase n=1 Tax=Prorocentrum cordatum TaxID=2364126 RepID=A0ABN9U2J9_9DINO|nr:unnamed protein product [Polarella glacialis]
MKVCLLLFLFWIGCIAVAVVTDPWALIHGFRVLHAASAAQSSEQHSSQPAPSQSLLEQTMTPRSSSQPALQKPIHAQTTTQQASGQSYTSQQFTEANKSGNVVGGPVKLHEAAQQIVKSGWQLLNLSAQAAQLVLNAVPIDLARQPEPRARVYSLGSSEGRLQLPPVEYSLIVNMHNRYKNLVTVLASYLITPRGSFELLAFCDGCNAKTLQRAEKAFDTYLPIVWNGSAAACSLEFLKSVTGHVAPGKSNQRYWEPVREMCVAACGDAFFRQCGSLRRAVLVDQPSAIYETASNNRGAILAEGQFLIIMQDDWVMTQIGWNVHMSLPARLYDDVFGISANCAHGWRGLPGGRVGRCLDDQRDRPLDPELVRKSGTFFVRPTGNRGPILYNASKFRQMGYPRPVLPNGCRRPRVSHLGCAFAGLGVGLSAVCPCR